MNEKYYDEEIAPALAELAKKCAAKKMAFVAVVEYLPGECGETSMLSNDADLGMIMLKHCAKMGTNIDGYVFGLLRYCNKHNIEYDSSIVMSHWGKPESVGKVQKKC